VEQQIHPSGEIHIRGAGTCVRAVCHALSWPYGSHYFAWIDQSAIIKPDPLTPLQLAEQRTLGYSQRVGAFEVKSAWPRPLIYPVAKIEDPVIQRKCPNLELIGLVDNGDSIVRSGPVRWVAVSTQYFVPPGPSRCSPVEKAIRQFSYLQRIVYAEDFQSGQQIKVAAHPGRADQSKGAFAAVESHTGEEPRQSVEVIAVQVGDANRG
jgi:hypothetical protein